MIGDEADDEQRSEIAEVECRLDEPGLARREPPCLLRQRQYCGIGDEPGGGENAAGAQRREPGPGSRSQTAWAKRTGMRRGPKGLPNFWKRPASRVPHEL